MITTSMQLKAKVRNLSGGDSSRAATLIRNYMMERFLERVSLSKYRNNFILKGGMLVASIVGLDTRATMDIDTTVRSLPLTAEKAVPIITEILSVDLEDGIVFSIGSASDIMEEHDYSGIRVMIYAALDKLRQPIKIDISTGDVITPYAVEYSYRLMFEDRSIPLWTYNVETLLGEKLETIMARDTANTRMRDFYDIHVISESSNADFNVLRNAFVATSKKRGTDSLISVLPNILLRIRSELSMREMWNKYKRDNFYVEDISWEEVNDSISQLVARLDLSGSVS